MHRSASERDRANRQLIEELREQRAEIQRNIEAAQRTVTATQDAITRSKRLLAQINHQISRADEPDGSEAAGE